MDTPKLQILGNLAEAKDETKVVFSKDYYTAHDIGKIKGSEKRQLLIEKGKTLADFMGIFDEEFQPNVVKPSVSITFQQAGAYEVGANVTPIFGVAFDEGSYEYDESTGVTVESYEVTDTNGNKLELLAGIFPKVQVVDGISYKITANVTHSKGNTPHTNQGNPSPMLCIQAGTKLATSGAITGYRNTFYGTKTTKDTLDSAAIRALTKSGKALSNGSTFNISIPVGALRVVIAYPSTLRDLTSVIDVNGMNTNIVGSFVSSAVTTPVYGENGYTPIPYKVYVLDFAEATTVTNTYKVTI